MMAIRSHVESLRNQTINRHRIPTDDMDAGRHKEMANRLGQQKPDPAMKKNVIRARQSATSAKRAQGFVVAASLAATLMGWALFSDEDDQVAATALLSDTRTVAS